MRGKLALAVGLALFLLAALYLGLGPRSVRMPVAKAQVSCCGIDTSNETGPLGDWDASYIFQGPSGGITRSNTYVQEGAYSYQHYSDCPNSVCWAWTYITCTVEMTSGHADVWFLMPGEPGLGGAEEHDIMGLGRSETAPAWDWADQNGWTLYWDYQEKSAMLACRACSPEIIYHLAPMNMGQWYHFRVEWSLESNSAVGAIAAWQDDYEYVNASGLTTEPGVWFTNDSIGVGVGGWHFNWASGFDVYVDNADISSCDPTPVPTPVPGALEQYGHAAVLNVDDDCSAVLRFRAVPNYVPFDATVQRATLHLWGVASEVLGETIYVAPLIPLWGEMTCDWCRRTVGETWADPGATNIPLDRYPGSVANFQTALGWIEVDIPAYLVEDWALSSASNPGLILSNENLTGKFGIASREWIDSDYIPYMTIYYTE